VIVVQSCWRGTLDFELLGFLECAKQFHLRLTHKIMALHCRSGRASCVRRDLPDRQLVADASRAIAGNARTISDLNKKLSMEMLEARRAEKDFQLRRTRRIRKAMPSCPLRSTAIFSNSRPCAIQRYQRHL